MSTSCGCLPVRVNSCREQGGHLVRRHAQRRDSPVVSLKNCAEIGKLFWRGKPDVILVTHPRRACLHNSRIPNADSNRAAMCICGEFFFISARCLPCARAIKTVDRAKSDTILTGRQFGPERGLSLLLTVRGRSEEHTSELHS